MIIYLSLFIGNLMSQDVINNPDIKIVVNTESINYTQESQQISLDIIKETVESPKFFRISMDQIVSIITPINIRLNGEKLWLIKSDSASINKNVLAWNYANNGSNLLLYPPDWEDFYTLQLDVQINIKYKENVTIDNSVKINLFAELSQGLAEATATGRGNEITINSQ